MKNALFKFLFLQAILFFYITVSGQENSSLEQAWLDAVKTDNSDKAIALAQKIIPDCFSMEIVNPLYVQIFQEVGIQNNFLESNFNKYDFLLWKHSLFFKGEASKIKNKFAGKTDTEVLKAFIDYIKNKMKFEEKQYSQPLWPYNILKRGFGVCDRQCSVFCELAYQIGFETSIIFLIVPETGISPHTICEIRSGKKVWIVDAANAFLLENVSLTSLISNRQLTSEKWPDIPHSSFESAFVMIPSYPQDYCIRNQLLYLRVNRIFKETCPRFGADPKNRQSFYTSLLSENYDISVEKHWKYGFFGNRLVALKDEMALKKFPKKNRKTAKKIF